MRKMKNKRDSSQDVSNSMYEVDKEEGITLEEEPLPKLTFKDVVDLLGQVSETRSSYTESESVWFWLDTGRA